MRKASQGRRARVAALCLFLSFITASWPGEVKAFTPYRLLVQAAKSPEGVSVFVQDKRLRSQLHRALIVAVPEDTLSVSPYVWGSHAYLVGWVDDEEERILSVKTIRCGHRSISWMR